MSRRRGPEFLTRLLVAAGADIAVNAEIATLEPRPASHLAPCGGADAEEGRAARVLASPRARRHAREAGLDLAQIAGGGPNGRIVEADVRAAIESHAPGARPSSLSRATSGRLHPLMEAAQWVPQVHLEADCRLDALDALRATLNERARAEHSTKVSLLDCLVKALAGALRQVPRANVAHAPGGYSLAHGADVALALTLDGEIVAPALPAADVMSLGEIAAARAAFLAGRFAPNSFTGGVSLVANLGALGVRRALPVVVAPWTSVLGIGAAEKRVIVEEGAPVIATMLAATLSIDRRAMDEIAGGALLAAFKDLVEHPAGLVD